MRQDQYRDRIQKVQQKLQEIQNIPLSQWRIVHIDEKQEQIYTQVTNNVTTHKLVATTTEADLDHFKACFSTIAIRDRWFPGIKDIKLVQSLNEYTVVQVTLDDDINVTCVEQVIKNKSSVQYTNIFDVDDQVQFLTCIVENNARVTVYYQWEKLTSVTYTISTLSTILKSLIQLKPFPYINESRSVLIQNTVYNKDDLDIEYIYPFEEDTSLLPAPAVDIHQKINRSQRWHSGSWEQQQQERTTLFKNKFMASSFLFTSSSTNSSPQLNPTPYSGHKMVPWNDDDEEDHLILKDELIIHTPYIPNLTITLPDKSPQFLQSFSQACISCYQSQPIYIIQIIHPQKFIHYLNQEPADILDEDVQDVNKPLQVRLSITKSNDTRFKINQIECSIKPWKPSKPEELDEELPSTLDEDINVFEDDIQDNIPLDTSSSLPTADTIYPIEQTSKPETNQIDDNISLTEPVEDKTLEIKIPEHDPVALQKIYPKFVEYLQPSLPTIIQSPSKENGYVTIKKFDIPEHPQGGFLGESVWKECSIWDIKSVLENAGARKIWDNTFENSTFLHTLTSSSALWHTKMKGAWPVSPRDYVCFHGQYTTNYRVDLLSTSCFGDSYQYKALPNKEIPGYVRATADVMGWRLEREDDKTVSVKQVIVTQFPTWVVNFITSRFITQTCAAIQAAQQFLIIHGAPPSLEMIQCAQLVNIKYDHERKNWRCEYTRRTDTQDTPSTSSIIRLDKRRWARHYAVVIDPPPSRVSALERVCDPYGIWLTVEHDEAFIIPLRGKILVLIKPDELLSEECHLNVNGVSTVIEVEKVPRRPKQASFSQNFLVAEKEVQKKSVEEPVTEDEKANKALDEASVSPKEHAQASLAFLKQTDEQFGWTVISDSTKQGWRISKKPGIKSNKKGSEDGLKVYEPYMVYKGSKVIENFSLEEVTTVVKDIHHIRKIYDDTIEQQVDLIRETEDPGLRIIRQTVKSIFPFKNREFYAVSCLAQEEVATKRVFYLESSLPDFPIINKTKTRGQFLISGWILEPIDPYNTTTANHPIPSTRVTYVASLDLGNAVPSYISNLVANNWFPKKIQAVETYLKTKGPPPCVTTPDPALLFTNNRIATDQSHEYRWTHINTTYDARHYFKITSHLSLDNKKKATQSAQVDEIVPSPSTSASLVPPFRRPSNHTISSGAENRRGSLPTNVITKKRNINVITPTSATITSPSTSRSVTFLQMTFDLRMYPLGYDIQAQLHHISENKRKDMTQHLVLSITEPPLTHLIDKKNTKHKVIVKAPVSPSQYEFEFSLAPARDEALGKKTTQLTVSHVLGEDEAKDAWDGTITVNGVNSKVNEEIQLKSLVENEEAETSGPIETTEIKDRDEETTTHEEEVQYGGSVVATALGNVSAGVNNIGARMLIPFRAASSSFLLSNSKDESCTSSEPLKAEEREISSSDDDEGALDDDKHRVDASTTIHEVRMLRRRSDTMRKGMLLLLICIGLAVVFALLMLQPLLERYYASFSVSSTIESLETSIDNGVVRRLMQIPWFGGWDIQLIAVRREYM